MGLTTLTNGALAGVGDVNQYKNLLTGVMTDQASYLNYRPGSGTTPTLKLDGDGHGPLILGLKTDHTTTAFQIDASGNLALAGTVTSTGSAGKFIVNAAGAADPDLLRFNPTDGEKSLAIFYDHTNDAFGFYNYTNNNSLGTWKSTGDLTITGALTIAGALTGATTGAFSSTVRASAFQGVSGVGASIAVHDNALGTVRNIKLYEGATDPATYDTVPEGSWWLKG